MKMLCRVCILLVAAISAQALDARDLEADIATADAWMTTIYDNAYSLQPNIANFQQVIFVDIVPYVKDIGQRMLALGIAPAEVQALDQLYDASMLEIQVIIQALIPKVGYSYLSPTSKTKSDLVYQLNRQTLDEDVLMLIEYNQSFGVEFATAVGEIDDKIENLFVLNWIMIQGTTGPDREAIDADREFIFDATTGYRDQLIEHMASLDQDSRNGTSALNVVISQLP